MRLGSVSGNVVIVPGDVKLAKWACSMAVWRSGFRTTTFSINVMENAPVVVAFSRCELTNVVGSTKPSISTWAPD